MKVFGLTDLGRRVARTKTGNSGEMRVMQYLYENRTATDSELDAVTGDARFICIRLKRRGLVRELTS